MAKDNLEGKVFEMNPLIELQKVEYPNSLELSGVEFNFAVGVYDSNTKTGYILNPIFGDRFVKDLEKVQRDYKNSSGLEICAVGFRTPTEEELTVKGVKSKDYSEEKRANLKITLEKYFNKDKIKYLWTPTLDVTSISVNTKKGKIEVHNYDEELYDFSQEDIEDIAPFYDIGSLGIENDEEIDPFVDFIEYYDEGD